MAPASFLSLPLHILHYLAYYIHPPDLLNFILTCKATSLLEVSGHAIRLHKERLSESRSINNEEELALTELLCDCIKNPWAGYYIEKLEILHGRDSWDLEWVRSYRQPGPDGNMERDPQEVIQYYLRIQEEAAELGIDAAIAAAKLKLPTQHSAEQLKLLEEAVFKAEYIADEEKLSWMEEIKLGSEVPIIALLLPRLAMLKELRCSDPLSLQRLNQTLHRIAFDPNRRFLGAFQSLRKVYWENLIQNSPVVTSVLPLMTLPALQEFTVKVYHWSRKLRGSYTLRDEGDESANWAFSSISPTLSVVKLQYAKISLTWLSRLLGSLKSLNTLNVQGGIISDQRLTQYMGCIPNISESVTVLDLLNLKINTRSLNLLLSSCHNLKDISLSGVDITSGNYSDDIDSLDLKPQSSPLCAVSLNNTNISFETLDAIIAFAKQLRVFKVRNERITSHVTSHKIDLLPAEAINILQTRASNTLHTLTLQYMKSMDALSMPSLRNFPELSTITIDDCILLGKKEPKLYNEPEKQDAWITTLPPLSEILPASLKSLDITCGTLSTIISHEVDKLSPVRPWSIRITEHFEKNYASTPCLRKFYYGVHGRLQPSEHAPEVDRLQNALKLHDVFWAAPCYPGGWNSNSQGSIMRERRKIIAPFRSKITTADTA